MSPVTHFLAGWLVANTVPNLDRRSRLLVTLAAILPDLDGFGLLMWLVTRDWALYDQWYLGYHHKLGHNFLVGLVLMAMAYGLAHHRKAVTAWLAGIGFHLHLVGDLLGSRGLEPQDLWPVYYLWPFSQEPWQWLGQWQFLSWQNFGVTIVCLAISMALAWWRGFSFVEIFSRKGDQQVVAVFRQWFPMSREQGKTE